MLRETTAAKGGKVIPESALASLLPKSVSGFERRTINSAKYDDLNATEVIGVYSGALGGSMSISIADLKEQPKMYRDFLTGASRVQGGRGISVISQASPQFSPQASPQFSPQASPQFSPQVSPQGSPQFSPQGSPQFSPQASPQFSPQASPQFSPQGSLQFSPQASPQFSPQASPQASPQFSPQVSAQFSPQASPQFSPQASPQFSPQGSLQFSPQVSRFSLSAASGADGSFIRPFGLDTGQDVAGWEMYDARTRSGAVILGVNDRVGIAIEASGIFPNALTEIASNLNFDEIDKLISAHSK